MSRITQKFSLCLIFFMLSQLLLEITIIRAQFITSQLMRRKEQAAKRLLREIEGLELSIKNHGDLSSKKDAQQDSRNLRQVNYSPQGRMVTQRSSRDNPLVDLNCDQDFDESFQIGSLRHRFSSRIECLNRDGADYTNYRKPIISGQNQNEILKMKSNFEKLIDQLNAQRASHGRS